jgi:hypothetical protein
MSKFVLLFTDDFEAGRREIEALGGRVTQKFTDRVFEAMLPEEADPRALRLSSPTERPGLDAVSTLMAAAWSKLGAKTEQRLKSAAGSAQAIPWDTKGYHPPRNGDNDPALRRPSSKKKDLTVEGTGTPTSLYMTGTVAVGLVVVSGTGSGLAFSDAEQIKVVSEVMEGLQFLAAAEPAAKLSFSYSINFPTISAAAPTTACASYEACEHIWRDPALRALGYAVGRAGCEAYVEALKQQTGSDWSYLAFFTKFPLYHFAYAYLYYPYLCMDYANAGWGPDAINQVFAHETCHIFGAADEYGPCGCGNYGTLEVLNGNCKHCTPNQVACLMNANTLSLCPWSRGQIGWSTWLRIPGELTDVSAAADGTVWGVKWDGKIYKYVDKDKGWIHIDGNLIDGGLIDGGLSRISVGSSKMVWGVDRYGQIYKYGDKDKDKDKGWIPIAGPTLTEIGVAADGSAWGVNSYGDIYMHVDEGWNWIEGSLSRISVGSSGIVWGVDRKGKIYKYNGVGGWDGIGGDLSEISAAADGTVWGLDRNGKIYRYNGVGGWDGIGGALAQISVGGAKIIWGVDGDGNIDRRVVGAA